MTRRVWMLLAALFWLTACGPTTPHGTDGDIGTSTGDSDVDGNHKTQNETLASLTGRITYQDRMYDASGFITGNTPDKAARRVVVDLLDDTGHLVEATLTDQLGNYQFDQLTAGDYTLRVLARAEADSGETLSVYNLGDTLYAVSLEVGFSPDQTTADLNIPLNSRMAGPFNLLDVMLSGTEFYHHHSPQAGVLSDLNLYWEYGKSPGTFTCLGSGANCSQGPGVYVLSDPYSSGDTDEFDDDVLWHEFAHHIEFSTGMTDSPGGLHSLADTDLDLRLSWSEGLANYFQTAVKTWLRGTHPERLSLPTNKVTHYIDTKGSYVGVSLDLATLPTRFSYATNEAAVAMALIGLQSKSGQSRVWGPVVETLPTNTYADTLETYWDGLLQSQPNNEELKQWRAVLTERAVQYQIDGLESDHGFAHAPNRDCTFTDQALPVDCITGERHTLYRASGQVDTDVLALDISAGVTYRIWTHDLRNGADTRIGLYRADGSEVLDSEGNALFNDDAFDCENLPGGCSPLHNGSHFSSGLVFQAERDERLYLVIDSAEAAWNLPANYGYLARYGDYAVSVELTEASP